MAAKLSRRKVAPRMDAPGEGWSAGTSPALMSTSETNNEEYQMTTITSEAYYKRLSRHLAKDGLILKTARTADASLGPFYTVNWNNVVEHQGLDWTALIKWGDEAGLLADYEMVATD